MTLLTGEEVRAKGLNPDTMISIGGKYDIGGDTSAPAQPTNPTQFTNPLQSTQPGQQPSLAQSTARNPSEMLTGEEVRAMYPGFNPDTLVSDGGKYSREQVEGAISGGGGGQSGGGGTTNFGGMFNQPTINLPQIFNDLYASSGISDLEKKLAEMNMAKTETLGKINDNPYLSEATRVGRVAKIEDLHSQRIADLRGQVATKKADIETQLNLQTKQFDINSQQAQLAIQQFNSLLSMGALDDANGETIANITRATGISSAMIQSAINASKASKVKTQVVSSTNDAGVVTISVINPDTGELIKQTSLGAVANKENGTKATAGEKTAELQSQFITALESKKNSYGHISPQDWQGALASWISRGGTRKDFIDNFQQYADPNRGDFDQVYFTRG